MPIQLLGIPYDARSSFRRGPAEAPGAIRAALHCGSANWETELGASVGPDSGLWTDLGDLELDEAPEVATATIRAAVSDAISDGSPLLSFGGDHIVTWPVVQAVTARHRDLTIVHFDAHPDLYDELGGDRYSHACPFARIMEEGNVARLVQIGIRTMTPHQREQARRFGVEVYELRAWDGRVPEIAGPVYVSIDLDALDPAFAPGVSHLEPGGLSTRQLIDALHQLRHGGPANPTGAATLVGADIVELNPRRDVKEMTAMVGAKLTRELLGLLSDGRR